MKKLLSVAICASAVAAFGTEVPVELGEVGVTAITSSTTNTIVAVSYTDLESGNITASNLVKTANLTGGDRLYVYSGSDGKSFKAFELDASGAVKYWKPLTVVEPAEASGVSFTTTDSADGVRIPVCTGVWLIRGSNWDGSSFTFYVYGKPVASYAATSIAASTSALVGNPTTSDKAPAFTVGPNVGDMIVIPDNTVTGTKVWKYSQNKAGTQTKWTCGTTLQDNVTIPAGTGFWYVATGAVTFNW